MLFGSPDLLLVSPTRESTELLGIGVSEFWDAAFSADGSQVAFNPRHGLEAGGITVKTLDDGRVARIPNQPPQDEYSSWGFAWSPDGNRIAFVNADRVFTITIDGRELRELGIGDSPTWTPDSQRVVFAHGDPRGADLTIAVTDVEGDEIRTLGKGLDPDVSPSGEEVAFSRPAGIFVQPLEGSRARLVVRNGFAPVWSPDGRHLAFMRHTRCGDACSGRKFVVPVEGGDARGVWPTMGDPGGPLDWIREVPRGLKTR